MWSTRRFTVILLACFSLLLVQCTKEQSPDAANLQPFYGTFKGTGENSAPDEIADRDLTVVIEPWEKDGFTVSWTTVIHRDGRDKTTDMSIDFYPSNRPDVFASAMRSDVFGNVVPYDPIKERSNPYVWAGMAGDMLTIHALYIVDNGGYEMQVYRRKLHGEGLSLEFERLRNGEKVTRISAILKRIK